MSTASPNTITEFAKSAADGSKMAFGTDTAELQEGVCK